MTLMGLVQSYKGLLVARFFLGVTESGLFPGVAYYITMWYCRHEAQLRQALFFSAASIAGAFSGLLAYGIAHMDGVGNLAGWRWIFILVSLSRLNSNIQRLTLSVGRNPHSPRRYFGVLRPP
jgi:MFS family permease